LPVFSSIPGISETFAKAAVFLVDMRIKLSRLSRNFLPKHLTKSVGLGLATITFFLCGCSMPHEHAANTDVSGNWLVTIPRPDGAITGMGSFKQTGHDVTGWVGPSQDQTIMITGVVQENQFNFKTFPEPGRNVAFDHCKLAVGNDKMTGTIEGGDVGTGTIEFVRAAK
jgi:hypothetical protein